MPSSRDFDRMVIAGASSLLGAELKSLLEESRFASWDFRLVDEELAAGTLTEAGGEAAVIQPVEEDSFAKAQFVFFTGSWEFTAANLPAALRSGAKVLDLSGMRAGREASTPWFRELQGKATDLPANAKMFTILSAPAASSALLFLALKRLGLQRLAVTHFQSVSEAGRAGIEELEGQTSQLLSFQPVGKAVFDTQVAFTLLNQYGAESRRRLSAGLERIRSEVSQALQDSLALDSSAVRPSLMLLHVPVFYGSAFSACAQLDASVNAEALAAACGEAGFRVTQGDDVVGNLSVAGENFIQLAAPQADPAQPGTWWLWGAADNIRLPAWNAVKLAEKLIE